MSISCNLKQGLSHSHGGQTVSASHSVTARTARLAVVIGALLDSRISSRRWSIQYLAEQRERLKGALEIIMYFEKPRTTQGWRPDQRPEPRWQFPDQPRLKMARGLLLDINQLGLPAGCEFLLITPQYIADFVACGAIGARTTESQAIPRAFASGLSCPVGSRMARTAAMVYWWRLC